jgi:hypothetical protein
VAVERFLMFLLMTGTAYPTTFEGLDAVASTYIDFLWQEGESRGQAGDTLSGLGHFLPATKRHLVGSWQLVTAWQRAELPSRAPPLTQLYTYALADYCRERHWTDTLVLLLLGFHSFPRTGELFSARCRDYVFNDQRTLVTWTLPLSKSGQREGAQEALSLDDVWLGGGLPHSLESQ